jgi:hypothetical protein
MVGSRVRPVPVAGPSPDWRKLAISRVRRLVTLLVMVAIATALSGVAPAAAGGKPMPATVRSAVAVNR